MRAATPGSGSSSYCDCGIRKSPCAHACRRCAAMDGSRRVEQGIISELRNATTATEHELLTWLGCHKSSFYKSLHSLRSRGRVVRLGDGWPYIYRLGRDYEVAA